MCSRIYGYRFTGPSRLWVESEDYDASQQDLHLDLLIEFARMVWHSWALRGADAPNSVSR
jgi:hypothetical protein